MTDLHPEDQAAVEQRLRLARMEPFSHDTSSQVHGRRLAAALSLPRWRKLQMALEMSATTLALTFAGLRHRHPGECESQLRSRLAFLLFDVEAASHLCDPNIESEVPDAT